MSLTQSGFITLPRGKERGFDHADTWLGDRGRIFVAHAGADRATLYVFCPGSGGAALFTR
jgi:hypothetical protein